MTIIKSAKKSVSQGWVNTQAQCTKHRANYSSAALFLSINTHVHRTNHSSVMLLWGMSKVADLPRVSQNVDTGQHYKFRYKHVTEVSQDRRNCLKTSINIALYKQICGHKKLKDSTKCCVSPDDDFNIITTVSRRHPSHGNYKVPMYASSLITRQGPGWPLVVQLHVALATKEIRLNRAPTQWTRACELCSCAPTAYHVSMSNWMGCTTLSIRDINPFVCLCAT